MKLAVLQWRNRSSLVYPPVQILTEHEQRYEGAITILLSLLSGTFCIITLWVNVTKWPSATAHKKRETNLKLIITGGDFKGMDGDVLPTIRRGSSPPPAILCLQNLGPASLNQEEDQPSNHQGYQHLSEHGAQCWSLSRDGWMHMDNTKTCNRWTKEKI